LSRNKGVISIETANNIRKNTPGQWSEVLQYKVPRGYFAQFLTNQGINMYLPTFVTTAHGGAGDEVLDLNPDAPVVDSAMLTDDITVKAYDPNDSELTVVSVDYVNNQVTVNHNTAEDVKIVYLPRGGSVRISVYRPSSGVQSYVLFEKGISTLHLMEQDKTDSLLTLDDPFPAPEKYLVKVEVNTDYEVDLTPNLNNKVGHIYIPFRKANINNLTQQHINRINSLFVSK